MSEITVNGVRLYYEEHGVGAPILCIHGAGSSAALWDGAVPELAGRGRTILYDRRGYSRSERPDPFVTSVHEHADDAAALLDALDAAPAAVIGRSKGGEVALDLALRYPDRVGALALLEGGPESLAPGASRWLGELEQRVFAAAEADPSTVGETVLRGVLGDGGWEALPAVAREIFTSNGPATVAELRAGPLDVGFEQLAGIAQPVLLVAGEASLPAFTEVMRVMAAAMPSARLEWVGGDHLIDPAHPVVLAFVEEVFAAPAVSSRANVQRAGGAPGTR
jgi:pimeloyl-ACP methyl ester carboxylesterase